MKDEDKAEFDRIMADTKGWAAYVAEKRLQREALQAADRELARLFMILPISGPLPDPCVMQQVSHALNHD